MQDLTKLSSEELIKKLEKLNYHAGYLSGHFGTCLPKGSKKEKNLLKNELEHRLSYYDKSKKQFTHTHYDKCHNTACACKNINTGQEVPISYADMGGEGMG